MTNELMDRYDKLFGELLTQPVYQISQAEKEALLLPLLNILQQFHRQQCTVYNNIMRSQNDQAYHLADIPYLAVRLFKHLTLSSVAEDEVFKVLRSSGTTSQTPATILLDKVTSGRQSKVLVKILQDSIGRARLPMLIIDSPSILRNKSNFNARAAGIQGMAFFGRDHTYALDDNMQIDWNVVDTFCQKYAGQKVLVFGFTFMVWQYFVKAMQENNKTVNLENGTLLHSGGWKKLEEKKVTNDYFKQRIQDLTGLSDVYNFYGMAEQVGSVFVECEEGHLHAPVFADVIVRDPLNFKPLAPGKQGLLQVISSLPTSYPGHSILTEDLGYLVGVDDCRCGRQGKYFKVAGRLPKTEVRGCSDTHQGGRG